MKIYLASLAVFAVGVSGLKLGGRKPVVLAKSRFWSEFIFTKMKITFSERFSYLQNEKHVFEVFVKFTKLKSHFWSEFIFTKMKKNVV